jgi:uncharacterized membrane protein YgdD (TMEM256/DUF423 family)
MQSFSRTFLIIAAGLFGALGVGGAALAAHGGDDRFIAIAAAIALVHAPALLALAALPPHLLRLRTMSGLLLVVGTMLFSGDLAARTLIGDRLFENAAPAGGMILIGGWILVIVGAAAAAIVSAGEK